MLVTHQGNIQERDKKHIVVVNTHKNHNQEPSSLRRQPLHYRQAGFLVFAVRATFHFLTFCFRFSCSSLFCDSRSAAVISSSFSNVCTRSFTLAPLSRRSRGIAEFAPIEDDGLGWTWLSSTHFWGF